MIISCVCVCVCVEIGSFLADEAPPKRLQYLQQIWDRFQNAQLKLDIKHYNTLLKVYYENDHQFVPEDVLADLKSINIHPDR